jgi:hypothetical protein
MRLPLSGVLAILVIALIVPATAAAANGGQARATGGQPGELLPDLALELTGFRLEKLPNGSARLRVGSTALNFGDGPFAVRGTRASTDDPTMKVRQRVSFDDGTTRLRLTGAVMEFEGDGHDHWHLQRFIRLQLYKRSAPQRVLGLRKLGFCIIDEELRRPNLPNASPERVFFGQNGCGVPDSLKLTAGISVGWADIYPADFVLQWIKLPAGFISGRYRLCGMVDAEEEFDETREGNNWVWHDLRIDVAAGTVERIRSGRTDCRP